MASNAPPLLPAASRLGGYEVVGLVGRGGMGEVYRAKQLSMEREVALKVLSPRLAKQDPAFAEQFVAEARAAGKLNHPNIVGVHDVGHAPAPEGCSSGGFAAGDPVHYFSMEFIEGETVKDVIERQGAVDLQTVGKVMTAMAEALAFAEAHKIVHRDIKPDNIMLTGPGMVKLADLGLALQADSAEAVAGSKDDQGRGKVMGTPLYMAPEQARAQPIDHRADQYALGATLFHMLTGRPPFQGETAKAIMRAHCFEPVPDPAEFNPQVPPPWRDLCRRMMAKAPEERFACAADLRNAIKATIRWKPGPSIRTRGVRNKPPLLAIAIVAIVVLAVVWLFVMRPAAPAATPGIPNTPAQPDKPADPGAAARSRASQALATLPDGPAEAIAVVDRLLADPSLAPARDLLQAKRTALVGALEEHRRNALRASGDAIDAKIAAGQLAEAREGLVQLPDEPWLGERRKALRDHLAIAERTSEARLIGAINAAANAAACDTLTGQIARSGLPEARRQVLSNRLEQRRRTFAAKTPPKPPTVDSTALWRDLGERCEPLRATLPYSNLAEALRNSGRNFPDADRPHLSQLANLVELAQQAEAALRLHIGQATPKAECRFGSRSGMFLLTKLEKDWIGFRLVDVPAESRADRASAVVPWHHLLGQALSGQAESPRMTAAFLWFWRSSEARAALARLKDDPMVNAVIAYEQMTRAINIAGEVGRAAGGLVTVAYPFAETHDAQYLSAWEGPGAELAERGLRWTSSTLVETKNEADLPILRWKGSLRLPVTLEATVQPEAGSEVVLFGLNAGELTIRVGLNPRRQGFFMATKPDGSGTYEPLSVAPPPEYDPNGWTRIRLTVDAAGKVAAMLNDKPLAGDRELTFPPAARLTAVIQGRGVKHGSGLLINALTISGKP